MQATALDTGDEELVQHTAEELIERLASMYRDPSHKVASVPEIFGGPSSNTLHILSMRETGWNLGPTTSRVHRLFYWEHSVLINWNSVFSTGGVCF